MFIIAYIILPVLIVGNLILIGVNLYRKKIHLLTAFLCVVLPVLAFYIHWAYFPEERQEGFIVLVRYPGYVLVQASIQAIIFTILRISSSYEKNPRRNYYRDAEDTKKEENSESSFYDLLDD